MTNGHSALGTTIRERRIARGWSQEELAERISTDDDYVRQSEISRIENGWVVFPRRHRLERLAAALDLPMGELLARSSWADDSRRLDQPRSSGATTTDNGESDQDAILHIEAARSAAAKAQEQLQRTLDVLRSPQEPHSTRFDSMYSQYSDISLEA